MPTGAILGAAGIGAVGSIVAGHEAASAAKNASATQLQMYQQTRADLQPFVQGGSSAFSQLANIFGFGAGGTGQPNAAAATSQLTQFPGYQFGLSQGVSALDRSALSRGMGLSGAQMQDAQTFGQQYAMQQAWQPYVSGLQWASNLGQNSAAQTGQAGATAANGSATSQLAGGNAAGNAVAGVSNSLASGLQQYAMQQQSPLGAGAGNWNPQLPANAPAALSSGGPWW